SAKPDRDVVCEMVNAKREYGRMANGAALIDSQICSLSANINERCTVFAFVFGYDCFCRGQWFQDCIENYHTRTVDTCHYILLGSYRRSHNMYGYLEPHPQHTEGIPDPVLLVYGELLGHYIDDFAV